MNLRLALIVFFFALLRGICAQEVMVRKKITELPGFGDGASEGPGSQESVGGRRSGSQHHSGRNNDEQKRKRGPTYMCKIWRYHASQHGGERFGIKFNKYGQPIGENKSLFVEFLGTIARNGKHAPLDIKSWDKMPKSLKRIMLDNLKEKFEIPSGSDAWILQSIGKKWRNWKADLKSKSYNPKLSIEEQLCNVPKRVLKDQWINLVRYWSSYEAKFVCERNQKSRANKTLMHTTGKRSFGQVREVEEKNIGRSPTRVEMFEKCYTKDGIPHSNEVGEALEKMKELRSQSSQSEDVGREDIFSKVLGNEKRYFGAAIERKASCSDLCLVLLDLPLPQTHHGDFLCS